MSRKIHKLILPLSFGIWLVMIVGLGEVNRFYPIGLFGEDSGSILDGLTFGFVLMAFVLSAVGLHGVLGSLIKIETDIEEIRKRLNSRD
jgi:hypothetical protein